jgi:general stress protein 26
MPLGTATIEFQNPEEHRERLHDLVQATRAVLVLSCASGDRIVGQPMVLLRTDDDTTMYVATLLGADQVATLARDPRVTVVVGAGSAMFDAEVAVSRDRALLDGLHGEAWKLWGRSKSDPLLKVLVISPIEGAYWDGPRRQSYQYRPAPPRASHVAAAEAGTAAAEATDSAAADAAAADAAPAPAPI